jgi:UDP:flavonoid glycosyltransferase YjiC (YdhE family)
MDVSSFASVPKNVIIRKRMPQIFVLSQADCSINHGGIHTINECIHFGVPVLVYSGKRSDQNGCAARVHFHEVGIRGDKDKDDVKSISSKIHDILTQDKYVDNIERLSQQCRRYKEEKTLEGIVHEYLLEKEVKI